jgi:hypothetical protein
MYEKLLVLSSPARKYADAGKMNNLVIINVIEIL